MNSISKTIQLLSRVSSWEEAEIIHSKASIKAVQSMIVKERMKELKNKFKK